MFIDPGQLVKRNEKTGQSNVLSDQELSKRLHKVDFQQPHNNILLKKNPLIL